MLKQKRSFIEAPITHKYLIQSKSVFPIQIPNLLNKNVCYIKSSLKIKMVAFCICICITFPCGEFAKPFHVKCNINKLMRNMKKGQLVQQGQSNFKELN